MHVKTNMAAKWNKEDDNFLEYAVDLWLNSNAHLKFFMLNMTVKAPIKFTEH